ncbi:hypothetical protein DSO57_1036714 [Entomophthora muscae]|uniref:Uncharacterized protein n=1 Tax=Entomophthora muscae TaxID=34485 RepID=A0ACC2U8U0_9FUNG|nr:hypothetical protein DSO57_1036714 [Entomophthora muscae]
MVVVPPEQEGLDPNSSLHPPHLDDKYVNPFLTRDKVRRTFMGTAIKALEEGRKPVPRDPFDYGTSSSLGSSVSLAANPPSPGYKTPNPPEERSSEKSTPALPPSQRLSQCSEASEHFSVLMLQRGKSLKSTQVQIASNPNRRVLSALPPKIQVPFMQNSVSPNAQFEPTHTNQAPGQISPPESIHKMSAKLYVEPTDKEKVLPPIPSTERGIGDQTAHQKRSNYSPETSGTLTSLSPPPETHLSPGDHNYPQKSKVQPFTTEKILFFHPKGSKHSSQEPLSPTSAHKPDSDFNSCACLIL